MEIAGTGEQIRDENERGRTFMAAAGMNPEFPWDDWYDKTSHHNFDSSVGDQMYKEEHRGLLLTSFKFEARVLAETAEDEDETWRLKSRLRAAGGAAAVAEQTLEEQILEIIGPTPHDPNRAQRVRDSPGFVRQKHVLGGLASLTL
eukprot:1361831-Rhodomonas_salina.1